MVARREAHTASGGIITCDPGPIAPAARSGDEAMVELTQDEQAVLEIARRAGEISLASATQAVKKPERLPPRVEHNTRAVSPHSEGSGR